CGKALCTKQGLKGHMLTHSGEKHYDCPHCNISFRFPSSRIRHIGNVHCIQADPMHVQPAAVDFI
ncbi:hypothetical protein PMAYCL1PPCAC_22442, partial [Pristionchus mayeri]